MQQQQLQLPEAEMEVFRPPKSRKVPVVYYLCRNRQLEHPHFIEISLVSPDGLYLRDVIKKFDAMRGRGMASMYSWSCKRSYKNAFVWNDISEDDLIFPAHGNEYVLKGSELVEEHMNSGETKVLKDDDDDDGSHRYKICKIHGLSDASTQTDEEYVNVKKPPETCTTSSSIDNATDPSTSSSSCSPAGNAKTDTLESLMKADNTFNAYQNPNNTKVKASNKLLQLISCGSISSQHHEFNRTLSCKSSSLNSKCSSRLLSSSVMLGELDCLTENHRFIDQRLENKECYSGNLLQTKLLRMEEIGSDLKRSYSYGGNRIDKCLPKSIKGSLIKLPRSESMRSFESKKIESNKENVIKIEERLASGARVIIHLKENHRPNFT